ncbi:NAD(P)-binding domain-containing protein [Allorhizocola rhizosphaerae]|uniref:NAD(P)-binding domain-containing protein n=1 Tax=Allorhizocola rhizosphaerae TaxID=1872709 RepID=UPI000E3D01C2|nr:NAD(P)-binding domain-containing protein [Allorhizocola rhizosphaerae]
MAADNGVRVSVLGLGAMGSALAGALVKAGYETTVWNRSPGRADALVAHGAKAAATAGGAVRAGRVVIACLLDHASVHEVLDPLLGELAGRTLINVTTTSPAQSRELAAWAARAGVAYLDAFQEFAAVIDGGDYTVEGQQSLEFSSLGNLLAASADQGISTEVVAMVQRLIQRQIDAGHGAEGFARIIESIKQPA